MDATHFDFGPTSCGLLTLWSHFKASNIPSCHSYFLAFAEDANIAARATELSELLDEFNQIAAKRFLYPQLIAQAVARWIYYSNRIELVGPSSLAETETILASPTSDSAKEVIQTKALLKKTYSSNPQLSARPLTGDLLHSWHQTLFDGLLDNTGSFRRVGVRQSAVQIHYYPHHQLVRPAMRILCLIVGSMAKQIDQMSSVQKRIASVFALAAFVQYHFMDIYPYVKGKGQLCRFLSKYYLDALLPLPCPMFEDRDAYLSNLIDGRRNGPEIAPKELALLCLDRTISFYKEKLEILNRSYDTFLCASSAEDLMEVMEDEGTDNDDKTFLLAQFDQLPLGTTEVKAPSGIVYKIMRNYVISVVMPL